MRLSPAEENHKYYYLTPDESKENLNIITKKRENFIILFIHYLGEGVNNEYERINRNE